MKKLLTFLSQHLIFPLAVVVLAPFATAVASYVQTGSWLEYFQTAPSWIWYAIAAVVVIWITTVVVLKRYRKIREFQSAGIFKLIEPRWGQLEMYDQPYEGVTWTITVPANAPWDSGRHLPLNPGNLDVDMPPKCPQCNTELSESKAFWAGYLWSCPNCDFRKRSSDDFFTVSDRVLRIARRNLREFLRQRQHGGGASA